MWILTRPSTTSAYGEATGSTFPSPVRPSASKSSQKAQVSLSYAVQSRRVCLLRREDDHRRNLVHQLDLQVLWWQYGWVVVVSPKPLRLINNCWKWAALRPPTYHQSPVNNNSCQSDWWTINRITIEASLTIHPVNRRCWWLFEALSRLAWKIVTPS